MRPVRKPCLVVGLGNPGAEYAATRHNAGFMALDRWADKHRLRFSRWNADGHVAQGTVHEHQVILLKPMTFMNRSGRAVKAAMQNWKIPMSNSIVVHDDMYTPLGSVKLKAGGSAAGHNGVQDILNLVPGDWLRLRFGISEPPGTQRRDQFVLAPFHRNEMPLLEQGILRSLSALDIWLTLGAATAQNECNPNRPQPPTLEEVLKRRSQRREAEHKAAAKPASTDSKAAAEEQKK